MKTSHFCEKLVRFLDATVQELNPKEEFEPVIKAAGSYIKNHKVNPHNIFDIVSVLWPKASLVIRSDEEVDDLTSYAQEVSDEDSIVAYDITFEDGSQGMIVSVRGLSVDFVVVS